MTAERAEPQSAVAATASHPLHAADRHWSQTNCYVDLWIELLHQRGLEPEAALSFTVTQDFEGDQFTFFKYPAEDLEILYGLAVQELAVYDTLERHCLEQAGRGNVCLIEVDSWFLPDTRGLSYRSEHTKTTIATLALDPAARTLTYFHNAGRFSLAGDDYDAIFAGHTEGLFPYAEFVRTRGPALSRQALVGASLDRLAAHLRRRPRTSPVAAFRAVFPAQAERLIGGPAQLFHRYAFNTLRQLGANFELMASYASWLGRSGHDGLQPVVAPALRIAEEAKVLQFRLARIASRRRINPCTDNFDALEAAYEQVMGALDLGVR